MSSFHSGPGQTVCSSEYFQVEIFMSKNPWQIREKCPRQTSFFFLILINAKAEESSASVTLGSSLCHQQEYIFFSSTTRFLLEQRQWVGRRHDSFSLARIEWWSWTVPEGSPGWHSPWSWTWSRSTPAWTARTARSCRSGSSWRYLKERKQHVKNYVTRNRQDKVVHV